MLPLDEWPQISPATVHCDDDEWDLVTGELLSRGILATVAKEHIPGVLPKHLLGDCACLCVADMRCA